MFYSATTRGFYDEAIHGARLIEVVQTDPGSGEVVDRFMEANPDCKIPADAIEITSEEHAALLAGQAAGKLIVPDANGRPVLADQPAPEKADIWERIKAVRDRRTETGGYQAAGKWFHSDQKSRSQQLGLARKADRIEAAGGDLDAVMHDAMGNPINWKTMDGSFVSMTAALAQQIASAVEASDLATHKAAEIHKAAMEASADPAAYDFSTGWPKVFGE